jgi:hypothetical protein
MSQIKFRGRDTPWRVPTLKDYENVVACHGKPPLIFSGDPVGSYNGMTQ